MEQTFSHIPVLLEETLELLDPERDGIYVDGTLGGGGHAEGILLRLSERSRLIGIDRDPEALAAARKRLSRFGNQFTAVHGNFFEMDSILSDLGVKSVDGILLDLGVSSHQLDTPERGFSFRTEAPLDMRMDSTQDWSAYDVVNGYTAEELSRILREFGEERFHQRIADRIVSEREKSPIETTTRLAEIVKEAIPAKFRREPQHPARRSFQAIRIEVNGELNGFRDAIDRAEGMLQSGGRFCIITFHSLEDRIVKQAFHAYEHPCTCDPHAPVCTCGRVPTARILTRKPIVSGEAELERNPRASCAKLRAIEKL